MTDFTPYQRRRNPDAAIEWREHYEVQIWKKEKHKVGWLTMFSRPTLAELLQELSCWTFRKYRVVKVTTKIRPLKIDQSANDADLSLSSSEASACVSDACSVSECVDINDAEIPSGSITYP